MSKRNLVTRGLAYTAVAGLSTLAFAPAAFATHDGTGHADSSASTGSGALFELLDTGKCDATDTATTNAATPTGRCGTGLNLNNQVGVFAQTAEAPGDGTSQAFASVAPIDIQDLKALDLTGILDGLGAIDTGTVLDQVLKPLLDTLGPLVIDPLRDAAIAPIDDALQAALSQVSAALPIKLQIGAVESQCVAEPGTASGNGTVAGINLLVDLGGQQVKVPINAGTAPNSNLLIGAPQDLVDDIIAGLKDTFTQSLGGALAPLNALLDTVQSQITDTLFAQLEPTLLTAVADALEPLVKGTVNEQTSTGAGQIEVTSLDLTLLSAAGDQAQNIKLGRTACGPNTKGTAHNPDTPDTPDTPDEPNGGPNTPAGPAGPNVPTVVNSGATGQENIARLGLGAAGTLLVMAGAGSLMRRRFADLG